MGGEFHAFRSEPVDVGCFEFLLAVAGEITVTEIVGQNVDDVWFFGTGRCDHAADKYDASTQKTFHESRFPMTNGVYQ